MSRFSCRLNTGIRLLLGLCWFLTSTLAFTPGFPYATEKVRGVNLGGWLVLEPWITPSLFDNTGNPKIIDEWTFVLLQGRGAATTVLSNHRDTWITESDFAAIKAAGLNHVRLPIGYWAFEVGPGEPYILGKLPYLNKAITWATNHELKLIIDLHGLCLLQRHSKRCLLLNRGSQSWPRASIHGRYRRR
ncbi:glycoside hydrolase superfamily [Mycena rosella]|uniref:Glycoside hydrolase superfamily n=1 Tax=Mycena rosella TaxID=1033263 RepID=A0AAD7DYI9_MYCRO|nr:glycoside hydrolase superfamily [Mycena rosella]